MARQRSGTATREAIRTAAARLFRAHGFAGTSVRDIAARAQADPALVIRHFGTKELLFLDTMHLTMDDEPLLDVPLESLGRRFVEVLLDSGDDTRDVYLALLRGSGQPQIGGRLQDTHETAFVAPLRARLAGPGADTRARLAGALIGGLLYALWVVGDEQLAAAGREEIVSRYGDLLQQLLTPDAATAPTSPRPTAAPPR
ncbi:AcrR family transcriptional regulator [Amycolatopsis bartoniae]|uniref:TetR family transcriptional regulator n=1 Tax=Amycolatopsis bartoniae TaxID=941986 RepID=A0A8H9ISF5_9PSEU|nr:TetR family transcriptional regulator [Amycolatopsis bartoniae]MBB2937180.1 AcrR family transcriptional regulator [Amycolatopsis bartoniae]TVT06050.1 TetR/AcrR family transcriptional regulator [Amycolatopsis bartoniae]GHF53039.1 TetR family transcriptional regulator [Amycolatopsis bartoniae]